MSDTKYFSISQKRAIDSYNSRKNIFITGPAGVGKSYIISEIEKLSCSANRNIQVTATTGSAAALIGGKTIHSWGGIGMGDKPFQEMYSSIRKKPPLRNRWRNIDVLVIDEVSMLSNTLFEKLNKLAKILRGNSRPFGGIQLVLSGEFYQLTPVSKDGEDGFCFECDDWDECIDNTVILDENMRQKDKDFQQMMLEIRTGELSRETKIKLKERTEAKPDPESSIMPTIIYTKRAQVEEINRKKMIDIGENVIKFSAKTTLSGRDQHKISQSEVDKIVKKMDDNSQYMPIFEVCKGCQVMLISNINTDDGLVNGSRGIVTEIVAGFPVVKFLNGMEIVVPLHTWTEEIPGKDIIIGRMQVPLRLAWAITHHKSQGISLDMAEIDVGKAIFEYGQAYVGLSRVRNINGLFISDLNMKRIKAHPKVKEFYEKSKSKTLPALFKILNK